MWIADTKHPLLLIINAGLSNVFQQFIGRYKKPEKQPA
jgi:hypothetical protein